LAAILILTTAGICQLVDAPGPQTQTANLIGPAQPPIFNFVEAAKKPKPVKVVNREFITHSALTGALMIADFETALSAQHKDPNLRESDPLFGSHPSHLRMYATALPIEAANAFLAYELKKHGHTKLWRVPFFVAETMHVSGIVSNLSPRPGGSFVIF
ncbi:MAG TPA: hypothetical protein VE994_14840, partial [Terriglobales bacterium]|nr:hypothetical protein [Terriglobales bacterium]